MVVLVNPQSTREEPNFYNAVKDELINPFTPKGFPTDEWNHLVLDRVKSKSAIWHSWEGKG